MSWFTSFYARLPVLVQHSTVSLYGLYWRWLRFGRPYTRYIKEYKEREKFGIKQWEQWQKKRLCYLLGAAAKEVPYYRETWTVAQKKAASAGCLDGLPLLNKEPLRDNPHSFLRQSLRPYRKLAFHTSGTTGTPITSIWTIRELRNSMALRESRSAQWAGVSFRLPRATFSGRLIVPNPQSKGPFYRFNFAERQVYFSAFHLRPDTAADYVSVLWKYKIEWLTGYAVSYYLLAKFILQQNLQVPPLKGVITTSEKLTPTMREVMGKAYGCRICEEYSTVENVIFASECEYGKLHVSPDAAKIEIIRSDGVPCGPGEVGEVVATCLMREYQPLIRYRLGDMAVWGVEPCSCGRSMPVLKDVVGRIEDVVVGPDGRQMVRFHGIFVEQPHTQEGQIIQEDFDKICVKIVPAKGFGNADTQDIICRVKQRLGDAVRVRVELVECIPRTAAGKFQAVISLLNNREFNGK